VICAPSAVMAEVTNPVERGTTRSSPVSVVTTVAPARMIEDVSTMCWTMRPYTSTPSAWVAVVFRVSRMWRRTLPARPITGSGTSLGHSSAIWSANTSIGAGFLEKIADRNWRASSADSRVRVGPRPRVAMARTSASCRSRSASSASAASRSARTWRWYSASSSGDGSRASDAARWRISSAAVRAVARCSLSWSSRLGIGLLEHFPLILWESLTPEPVGEQAAAASAPSSTFACPCRGGCLRLDSQLRRGEQRHWMSLTE
jgi:hypothetical protein